MWVEDPVKKKVRRRAYYLANREKALEYQREYRKNNLEQELKRNRVYRNENRDKSLKYNKAYYEQNAKRLTYYQHKRRKLFPERQIAYHKVGTNLGNGNLIKPEYCEFCQSTFPLEAHHEDYSKPLDIWWLCRSCHLGYHHMEKRYAEM